MVVYRSPFSNTTPPAPTPKSSNPLLESRNRGKKLIEEAKGVGVSADSSTNETGMKTSVAEEQQKLNSTYSTALAKVANSKLSEADKAQARKSLEATYKLGIKPEVPNKKPNLLGLAGKAVGATLGAGTKGVMEVLEATQTVSRFAQSGIKEIADMTNQYVQSSSGKRLEGGQRASWSDFMKQGHDKDFRLMPQTGVKWLDTVIDFGVDMALDPTSYVGVGAVGLIGKAGRSELALKFGTEAMRLKYPQLIGKADDIMRYGAAAIPKEVRAAENVKFGVRAFGAVIPKTEALASVVSGKAGVGTLLRAGTGDIIEKVPLAKAARVKLSPSSRAGMVSKGLGRRLGLDDDTVIKEVAHYTSARAAKGFKNAFYRKATYEAQQILSEIEKFSGKKGKGDFGKEIVRLMEDPVLRAAASPEKRDFAERLIAWQNGKYGKGGVDSIIQKFNLDYGGTMKEIGFVDDYVHHTMTEEALREVYKSDSKLTGFFKDGDLTSAELGQNSSAARFRKYKKGEKFMDVELQSGTIDEINAIFRKEAKVDFDFFETDLSSVVDSYAYSMANARGREAYVRRLMDYGSDVVRVLNTKSVPDAALVSKLTASHASLTGLRRDIVSAVNKGSLKAKDSVENVLGWAQGVMNTQQARVGVLDSEVAGVQARIARIEVQLADAAAEAGRKGVEARGSFQAIHKTLLEDLQNLKHSVANGEMYQQAAYIKLREIYVQMFPDSRRVPKSVDVLIDKISRETGMSRQNIAEVRTLTERLKVVQQQIADTPPDAGQIMNDLIDTEAYLVQQIDGFSTLGDVRFAADYSEDGFIYGTYDDLIPRQFDPNLDPMPRVVSTRPMVAGDQNMTTDEIMAAHNAFMKDGRSVAAHAIPNDVIHDMRKPEHYYDFWDPEGGVGEAVGYALSRAGIDTEGVFLTAWDDVLRDGATDPMFEQVYPALDDLMTVVGSMHAHQFELGVVDDDFLVEAFDTVRDVFVHAAADLNLENADEVGIQMMNDFMRAMAEEGMEQSGKPLLVPSRVIYGLDNPMAEDAYSLILPDNFSYVGQYGKESVDNTLVDGMMSPVFPASDEFVQSIANSDYVSASLGAVEKMDEIAIAGRQMQDALTAREVAVGEARSVGGKIGSVKREASRRVREAEVAYRQYENFGTVTIPYKGKKIEVPREKAIKILNEKEGKVTDLVANLEVRIGNIGKAEAEKLNLRKAVQEERLSTLFNQRKVLERWTDETGVAMQQDIDLLRQAIATDPPTGAAGTMSRRWADDVRDRINNIQNLGNTPEAKTWEKIVKQLHADESQLAFLDSYLIPYSDTVLNRAIEGSLGGTLMDDLTEGWVKLGDSLGVEVPKDFYDIARPQIDALRKKANRGPFVRAISHYHALFKQQATMSVGFMMRNAISSTFMNYVAGVPAATISRGTLAMQALRKHGPEKWLDELGIVDPVIRDMYESALRAVDATGRGITTEIAMQPVLKGGRAADAYNKVTNNPFTRFFGKGNDIVEQSARFPMALDTLERGLSYDEAIYRISRYHFDYSDLSKIDEKMRAIVPFWIWTTRNIPLQITEQIYRPKAYMQYENIRQRNPVSADLIMPAYLREGGPMALGKEGWILNPDLPQTRLKSSAAQLYNPSRLVGMMYPEVKLPLEIALNKSLATDIPFTDKYDEAKGIDKLAALLLEQVGVGTRRDAEGKLGLAPALSYGIGNAIPLIGKAERLSGGVVGGKSSYEERALSSLMTELGIPARKVGPRQRRGEIINRTFSMADFIKELTRTGDIAKEP